MNQEMRTKYLKLVLFLLAAWLLTAPPIAFAYGSSITEEEAARVEAAGSAALPGMRVFGKALGGVIPGDLFYIDATSGPADITVILSLTNSNQLINCYRYLILKVGVYVRDDLGEWKKALTADGQPIPDDFITLLGAQASFTLAGYAKYKITLDGGSFYCTTTDAGSESLLPQFHMGVI